MLQTCSTLVSRLIRPTSIQIDIKRLPYVHEMYGIVLCIHVFVCYVLNTVSAKNIFY